MTALAQHKRQRTESAHQLEPAWISDVLEIERLGAIVTQMQRSLISAGGVSGGGGNGSMAVFF